MYLLPNYTDTAQAADSTLYKGAIDESVTVHDNIAGAFYVYEAATPNMTVVINKGKVQNGINLTDVAAQTTTAFVAPVTDPRIDRIVIDQATGVYSVIAGTEAPVPSAPALTAGKIAVAQILLQTASTIITNSMISDERSAIIPYSRTIDIEDPYVIHSVMPSMFTWTTISSVTELVDNKAVRAHIRFVFTFGSTTGLVELVAKFRKDSSAATNNPAEFSLLVDLTTARAGSLAMNLTIPLDALQKFQFYLTDVFSKRGSFAIYLVGYDI